MMRLSQFIFLLLILTACGCWRANNASSANQLPKLELVAAYVVDMPKPLEPSGLAHLDGQLYTVADKDNHTIYKVEFKGASARLVPHIRFSMAAPYPLDWEGITVDDAGNFFLISEDWGQILRVTPGGEAAWVTPDLRPELEAVGLYAKSNAGFEGIAMLGPDHWLGAVEREPRGLAEIRISGDELQVTATDHTYSPFSNALPLLRLPDYSGLDTDGDRIFGLFRNAHLVVRLERSGDSFIETEAWSYRHIEIDPRYAYRAQVYGQAEGLVVMGRDVYLIFDNNLGPRQSDPNDGRPLLIHARFPGNP